MDSVLSTDLIISSQGFGLLRKALIENMGIDRAATFLFQFGKDLGISKAKEFENRYASQRDLVLAAAEIHRDLGHISGLESRGRIIVNDDGSIHFVDVHGRWFDSFEAKLHHEHFGSAPSCICYTLSGFASGYLSAIYKTDIYAIETKCRAMGHADCSFEINEKAYWQQQGIDSPLLKESPTILQELSLTYDSLLHQKQMLNKVLTYHSELTDCVVKEDSLNHVVHTAHSILNIPIIIRNDHHKIIAMRGISEERYAQLKGKTKKSTLLHTHNETTFQKEGSLYEMTTPVYLDSKLYATCSFIYEQMETIDEVDYVFLERLASVATLCFMKEKISFETTERFNISMLDQLLHEPASASHFDYALSKLEGPYYMLKIHVTHAKNEPFDNYDQLLLFAQTFKTFYLDALLTKLENQLVVLLCHSPSLAELTDKLQKIVQFVQRKFPQLHYKIGVSASFQQLTDIQIYMKQAMNAVNLPKKHTIIAYEELGLLGNFLSSTDLSAIKLLAQNELRDLLLDKPKNKELLHTLYTFLLNGKHLEKTMQELSLSLGGLQYRIRKIEDMTGKNLKDFTTASYLLLLIESLLTLGEIEL